MGLFSSVGHGDGHYQKRPVSEQSSTDKASTYKHNSQVGHMFLHVNRPPIVWKLTGINQLCDVTR